MEIKIQCNPTLNLDMWLPISVKVLMLMPHIHVAHTKNNISNIHLQIIFPHIFLYIYLLGLKH